MDMIRFLAGDDMKGSGFGTAELGKASDLIAARFRDAGLKPGSDRDIGVFSFCQKSFGFLSFKIDCSQMF